MNNTPQRLRASLLGGALFLSGALVRAPIFAQDPEVTEPKILLGISIQQSALKVNKWPLFLIVMVYLMFGS